jgi:hypothetical protein
MMAKTFGEFSLLGVYCLGVYSLVSVLVVEKRDFINRFWVREERDKKMTSSLYVLFAVCNPKVNASLQLTSPFRIRTETLAVFG